MTEPPELDLTTPAEVVELGEDKPKKLVLRMVIYPDKRLREKATGMCEDDIKGEMQETTRMVAGAMIRAMYKYGGVGLAAQQVGFPGAMFVTDSQWPETGRHKPKIFINPNVRGFGQDAISLKMGEGCLSLPYGIHSPIERSAEITVEWRDLNWELHKETFTGTEAIVMQHEIDHLHGNLFIDHLSRLKQDIIKRKIRKIRKKYLQGWKATRREILRAVTLKKRTDKRRKLAKRRKK